MAVMMRTTLETFLISYKISTSNNFSLTLNTDLKIK